MLIQKLPTFVNKTKTKIIKLFNYPFSFLIIIFFFTFSSNQVEKYANQLPDQKTVIVSTVTDKYSQNNDLFIIKDDKKIKVTPQEYSTTPVNQPISTVTYTHTNTYYVLYFLQCLLLILGMYCLYLQFKLRK